MRILVCGGRDYGDLETLNKGLGREDPRWEQREKEYNTVLRELDKLAIKHSVYYKEDDNWLPSDIVIINGAARGADSVSSDWAVVNWVVPMEFPADWNKYGKRAGYIRNQRMLDEGKPDLCVAFPGGRGTMNMKELARKAGVEVIEIEGSS